MRLYLPCTLDELSSLINSGLVPAGAVGFAATPSVARELGDLADEELEYAVSTAAAEASGQLLLDAEETTGRRVVLVAELPASAVEIMDDAAGQVRASAGIAITQVQALLADTEVVALAGSEAELGWFAMHEAADLLA